MQRTSIISDRDASTATACIDDSGGGDTPVDNNNIGDDDTDNNGNDHILKRSSISVQRHSFEEVEGVIENENDDDNEEDDTSQGTFLNVSLLSTIFK